MIKYIKFQSCPKIIFFDVVLIRQKDDFANRQDMYLSGIMVHAQKPTIETRKGKRVEREILGGIWPQIVSESQTPGVSSD